MSTPRFWLGISSREWLINSNTSQHLPSCGHVDLALDIGQAFRATRSN